MMSGVQETVGQGCGEGWHSQGAENVCVISSVKNVSVLVLGLVVQMEKRYVCDQ